MAEPEIELFNVGRMFAGPPVVGALRSASLRIMAGEYVAIMGRSGSGKSTLLNILGLLDRPTSGEYALKGRAVSGMTPAQCDGARARLIGFVFQASHMLNNRSVLDNVKLGLALAGTARTARTELATSALVAVGLGERLDALAATLSGGERQRAAIARAIAKQPAVLLCDEPTGDLDSATAREVLDVLDELRARTTVTTVIITHDELVARRAKRIVTIADGTVVP